MNDQTRQPASTDARGPSATTSTRRSSVLRAHPESPSSRARARVHQRKPTPCTCPRTKTVARTSGAGSSIPAS